MLPVDAGGAAALGASMKAFAQGAASGAFAVSPTGGQALIQAIQTMKDDLDRRQRQLQELRTQPPLGQSEAANVMRPYVASVASDSQGFLTMLLKLRESLEDAEQGIKDAMANYQATDEGGAGRLQ